MLTDLGDLLRCEPVCEAHYGRPQLPMNERDLSVDQPTDKDLLGLGDLGEDVVDRIRLGMRPSIAADWLAGNGFNEARGRTFGRRQDNPVRFNEGERTGNVGGVHGA